jgi:hypothetical protein
MDEYTYTVVDTITGVPQGPLYPTSEPFERAVDEQAENQTTLPLEDSPFTAAELAQITEDWSRTIVISRKGTAMYAGIIVDFDWDEDSGMLTLEHIDYEFIFGSRSTMGSNGYSGDQPINNNLILANFALSAIPAWLVWASTEGPTANYALPIYDGANRITNAYLLSLSTPGTWTFEYWDYELPFVDEAYDKLRDLGLEITFQPRWSASRNLELELRTGKLTGNEYEFNLMAPKCALSRLRVRKVSRRKANVVYSVGKGSERDMRVTTSRAVPVGPALELAVSYKDVDDMVQLKAYSDSNLAKNRKAIVQWEFDIPVDFGPGIEKIPFGSTFKVYSRGHKVVPDGWNDLRYLGFEIDPGSPVARVTVQPNGA